MNYVKLLNILGKLVKEGQIKSINEALKGELTVVLSEITKLFFFN